MNDSEACLEKDSFLYMWLHYSAEFTYQYLYFASLFG